MRERVRRPWLSMIQSGNCDCEEMIASRRVARSLCMLTLTLAAAITIPGVTAAHASRWTVYHHDALGTGVYKPTIDLSGAHQVWTSSVLQGQLYGEPLVNGS